MYFFVFGKLEMFPRLVSIMTSCTGSVIIKEKPILGVKVAADVFVLPLVFGYKRETF